MLAKTPPLRRRAPRGIYENSAPNGALPMSSAWDSYQQRMRVHLTQFSRKISVPVDRAAACG
jgi:hypothetical protein